MDFYFSKKKQQKLILSLLQENLENNFFGKILLTITILNCNVFILKKKGHVSNGL